MPLDEVSGHQLERRAAVVLDVVERRDVHQPRQHHRDHERPQPPPHQDVLEEQRPDQAEQGAEHVPPEQLHDHAAGDPPGLGDVHAGVDDHHQQVARGEDHAVGAVGVRDRHRGDEVADHPEHEQRLTPCRHRRGGIGQPGVPAVHPPQDEQQQRRPPGDLPAAHQHGGGELGDREDEDQVEEQLQRRDLTGHGQRSLTPTSQHDGHPTAGQALGKPVESRHPRGVRCRRPDGPAADPREGGSEMRGTHAPVRFRHLEGISRACTSASLAQPGHPRPRRRR